MTIATISTAVSRRDFGYSFAQAGDELHVTPDGSLTSTRNLAIHSSFDHSFLLLEGNVRSDVTTAISVTGGYAQVQILGDAVVSSAGLSLYDSAVAERGAYGNLYVQGAITTASGGAVTLQGEHCSLSNFGDITGASFAVHLNSNGAVMTNGGTITATAATNLHAEGAVVLNYGDDDLNNTGTIAALGTGMAGLVIWDNKVDGGNASGFPGTLENHGIISASGGYGVLMVGLVNWQSHFTLINTGVISGFSGSVQGDGYRNIIQNSGTMIGDVVLAEGDDIYDRLGGTVAGRILGGTGNDLYRISDAAAQIVELANGGRDRIEAAMSFDMTETLHILKLTLLGYDALHATGNSEDNFILGNVGSNALPGAGGYDRLFANRGDDLLDGGTGEDQLYGGGGRDSLFGGDGDDRLSGGAGQDVLTGGEAADVFVFGAVGSNSVGVKADTIMDFVSGIDRVNLAAIDADPLTDGDQALTYIGDGAFGAVAGQVRYAWGILQIDMGGDGAADMQISLTGAPTLVATDLSL